MRKRRRREAALGDTTIRTEHCPSERSSGERPDHRKSYVMLRDVITVATIDRQAELRHELVHGPRRVEEMQARCLGARWIEKCRVVASVLFEPVTVDIWMLDHDRVRTDLRIPQVRREIPDLIARLRGRARGRATRLRDAHLEPVERLTAERQTLRHGLPSASLASVLRDGPHLFDALTI